MRRADNIRGTLGHPLPVLRSGGIVKATVDILDKVINGDCLHVLQGVPDAAVALVITSPPYAERRLRTYGGIPADEYCDWFLPRAAQLFRVLKPTGSFVLNIKEGVDGGERQTYVMELVLALRKQGWRWVDDYIWHKRNCFPGKWPNRFRDAWEHCLHFTKQKTFYMNQDAVRVPVGDWSKSRLKSLSDTDRRRDNARNNSGFGKNMSHWVGRDLVYPSNVLHLPTECSNKQHSAAFPVALPKWFINLFTEAGDLVLDPFVGSGTTVTAAQQLGRHFMGIDVDPSYCELARQKYNVTACGPLFECTPQTQA